MPALVRRETALARGWSTAGVTHRVPTPSAAVKSKPLALYAAAVGAAFCGAIASAEPLADAVFSGGSPGSEITAGLPITDNEVPSSQAAATPGMAAQGDGLAAADPTTAQPRLAPQEGSGTATTSAPAPPPRVVPAMVPAPDAPSRTEPVPAPPQEGGERPPQEGGEQPPGSADDSGDSGGRPVEGDQAPGGGAPGDGGGDGGDRVDHDVDRGDDDGSDEEQGGRHRAVDGDGQGGRHRAEDSSTEAEDSSTGG